MMMMNGRISRQVQGFLQYCCSYRLTLQNETMTNTDTGFFQNCKSRSCARNQPFCATKSYADAIERHLPDTAGTNVLCDRHKIFWKSCCNFVIYLGLIRKLQTRLSAYIPGILSGVAVTCSKSFGNYHWFYPHPSKFSVKILLRTVQL